jgi:hypothetical protein
MAAAVAKGVSFPVWQRVCFGVRPCVGCAAGLFWATALRWLRSENGFRGVDGSVYQVGNGSPLAAEKFWATDGPWQQSTGHAESLCSPSVVPLRADVQQTTEYQASQAYPSDHRQDSPPCATDLCT